MPAQYARFAALGPELRFLFITSHAHVHETPEPRADAVPAGNTGYADVWVAAAATDDPKCVRCWQRRADVGSDRRHPQLCLRCVSNVEGPGERRVFV
jgi:isoleucyl-tRNA synthetase